MIFERRSGQETKVRARKQAIPHTENQDSVPTVDGQNAETSHFVHLRDRKSGFDKPHVAFRTFVGI